MCYEPLSCQTVLSTGSELAEGNECPFATEMETFGEAVNVHRSGMNS